MTKKSNRHLVELQRLLEDESNLANTKQKCEQMPSTSHDKNSNVEVEKAEKLESDDKSNTKAKPINFQKVRYEVLNFGISGLASNDKEKAKVALAIKLGAKPPKNKFINYKQLQALKKEEKRKFEENADDHYFLQKKKKKPEKKFDKVKNGGVSGFDEAFGKINKPKRKK